MKLPIFAIVGDRPVCALSTEDGGMEILAWDWDARELRPNLSYLTHIMFGMDEDDEPADMDIVTEEEFEQKMAGLRQRR